ncbi:MAG: hypothetical protein Q8S84_02595 [bacterium]|nr:hypothetical protein [bacterium]
MYKITRKIVSSVLFFAIIMSNFSFILQADASEDNISESLLDLNLYPELNQNIANVIEQTDNLFINNDIVNSELEKIDKNR